MKVIAAILIAIAIGAQADIQFSRTVNTINKATGTVTLDSGCTSKDAYGSNDCDLHWGEKHTVTIDGALQEDLNGASKFSVKATVLGIIPFDLSCPLCGANCTATIPVINKKITIAMPACPLPKGALNKAISFTLPAKSPVPLSAALKGDVTITDDSGATVLDLSLTAKLSPSAAQLALAPKLRGPESTIKACGCTCQCSGLACGEASKAKGLCSEATSHGITNGEACSKAQGTLNNLAHGLAKLSGCTGTFSTGGGGAKLVQLSKKKPDGPVAKNCAYGCADGCPKDRKPGDTNGCTAWESGDSFCNLSKKNCESCKTKMGRGNWCPAKSAAALRLSPSWLASVAGPAAGSHYEDPSAGPCQTGEEAVQIQGVKGGFCSPQCGLFKKCPTDVPAGTTATPECALETPGSKSPSRCALICQASSKCPAKASCKMVQGAIGLCTYDS